MNVVVYQSFWGNTAKVAAAIAEGLGDDTRCLSTSEATPEALEGADLIVAGAPIHGFSLPPRNAAKNLSAQQRKAPTPPDVSQQPTRDWLDALPAGSARVAAFETGLSWSPGSAAKKIVKQMVVKGYESAGFERFIVTGTYGPLAEGELERARAWGASLVTGAL
jgi:hypothetical protein